MKTAATPEKMTAARTVKLTIPTKRESITYALLLAGPNRPLSQIRHGKRLGTTCLHSDISALANKYGLVMTRAWIPHASQCGVVVRFRTYALADAQQAAKAIALVNHWRRCRRAEPLAETEEANLLAKFG